MYVIKWCYCFSEPPAVCHCHHTQRTSWHFQFSGLSLLGTTTLFPSALPMTTWTKQNAAKAHICCDVSRISSCCCAISCPRLIEGKCHRDGRIQARWILQKLWVHVKLRQQVNKLTRTKCLCVDYTNIIQSNNLIYINITATVRVLYLFYYMLLVHLGHYVILQSQLCQRDVAQLKSSISKCVKVGGVWSRVFTVPSARWIFTIWLSAALVLYVILLGLLPRPWPRKLAHPTVKRRLWLSILLCSLQRQNEQISYPKSWVYCHRLRHLQQSNKCTHSLWPEARNLTAIHILT